MARVHSDALTTTIDNVVGKLNLNVATAVGFDTHKVNVRK
jgi:hypothetical protein